MISRASSLRSGDSVDGPYLIGALVPLSRPGWVEAGRHLLAGLELGAHEITERGGIGGRPLKLVVRDSGADPQNAAAAMSEFAEIGAVAVVGEYHSVAARVAAEKAETLSLPFLCSSAVLDTLTESPTNWVARIAPGQSRGWRLYADYLLSAGHDRIALAIGPGAYWAAGTKILRDGMMAHGGDVVELDANTLPPSKIVEAIIDHQASALLLLIGYPEPAASIVKAVRNDARLANVLIGAPAGQPEFADWAALLGTDGTEVPFLRYRRSRLAPIGERIDPILSDRLGGEPSFVTFEGYDTIAVLAALLDLCGPDRACLARSWDRVSVDGTRGTIQLSRVPSVGVWQWAWPPIEVVDRDPEEPGRFRVLYR